MLNRADNAIYIAGIDEAGRGPLAGPVIAASVILDMDNKIEGLADSKKITAKRRAVLYDEIKLNAFAWGIGRASASEIDEINIHQATLLAMQRAYLDMRDRIVKGDCENKKVEHVYIDGLHCPQIDVPCTAVVKGDQLIAEISAASILAKVTRDREMEEQHESCPEYGFNQHKGYPTAQHILALREYGPCHLHRKSYKPVKDALALTN